MNQRPGGSALRLQPLTRARVRALGEEGNRWQQRLPIVLAELHDHWQLEYGRPLPGGSSSYVCRASRAGRPVVIKVSLPTEDVVLEANTLRRADGRGYVRLLDFDSDRHALLLERLRSSLQSGAGVVEDQLRCLAETLGLAWQRPARHPELDRRPAKSKGLAELIRHHWSRLSRPGSRLGSRPGFEAVIAQALEDADWLDGHPVDDPVVVHGDPHPQNLLRVPQTRAGAETGYCFVDPTSFVEDPGYDLGVAMRDFSSRLLADRRPRATAERYADILAEHSGVEAERIWRWAFVERVSTGLYVSSFGAERVGGALLDSAAALLA